jgi:hypothetical protein
MIEYQEMFGNKPITNQDYVLGNDITAVGVAMTSLANPFKMGGNRTI